MSKSLSRETRVLTRKGPRTGPLHDDQAQLVHALGPYAGQRVQIEGSAVLGREEECDVVVDDEGTSRRHAQVDYDPAEGFFIEDLGSRNGTFVNGVSVQRSRLAFGDKIAIGAHTVFLFTRNTPLDDQVIQAQKLQMLGELAGGIVHDFNNILAAFGVGMDLLREMCGGEPRVDECLRFLDDAAARGADLTSQLLGFARGGSMQHDRIDLSQVVSDAVRLLRRMVPRTVAIRSEIQRDVGIQGSSSQILQVIVNLAINSADAMPEGGELIIQVSHEGDEAVLEVTDNGKGMDVQTLERALDPFFTTKPRGHGTGLGLATVDRVVREHHGTVGVWSQPGIGTTMTVRLPFRSPRPTNLGMDVRAPSLPAGTVVLMVDDDPVVRALTVQMLEAAGAEVLVAENGLQGLQVFEDNADRLSVVLLDLDLPRLSGEEVFEEIRRVRANMPVIIASGYLDDERARRLMSAGVAGFMNKPFRRVAMLSTIVGCLTKEDERTAAQLLPVDPPESSMAAPSSARDTLDEDALAELRALDRSRPGILAEVAQLYLDKTPSQIDAIERAPDPGARAGTAHMLKGSSFSLGVSTVGRIAAAIEIAARSDEACDHMIPQLRAAFDAVAPQLWALARGSRRPGA